MLLDPAISGAIAADRVAWMALAKFNTGGQLGPPPPHVSIPISPNLPPPTAPRQNCTLHTTLHKDKDKDIDKGKGKDKDKEIAVHQQ